MSEEELGATAWTADGDGLLRTAAEWWLERAGLTLDEMTGGSWHVIVHVDDRVRTFEAWNRALETGMPYSVDHRVMLADGKWHPVHSSAEPVRNESGEIVEWIGRTQILDDF